MKAMLLTGPAALLLLVGCGASKPTAELVNARAAYARAQSSEANALTPARVLTAKQSLERAEKAHHRDPGSFDEKSLAYIAQRQSELAQAYGELAQSERERQAAAALYQQRQAALRENAERSLEETQSDLESARRELAVQGAARAQAEQRLQQAMQRLTAIGKIRQDARGTVLTLDGAVLFQSGKSSLAPTVRGNLNSVADALKTLDPGQTVVVEGHTDSVGSDENNQKLSQQRAEAVRDYLVERGVRAEQIRAEGRGESNPIAENDTAEGRATNRRVELVISWAQQGQSPGTMQPGSMQPGQTAPQR